MKSKLLKLLGPLAGAFLLIVLMVFLPLNLGAKYSHQQLVKFAQAPYNTLSFTGYSVKKQAFSDPSFLPILGSSELGHVDPFHPSVYFTRYSAGFTPYLAGQPGTTSLTQFFFVKSAAEQLKNRKMVFIISPQWFTAQGMKEASFANFVSKGEIYSWMKTADPKSETTAELARRLLSDFSILKNEKTVNAVLHRFAKNQGMTYWQKVAVSISLQFWKKEDLLFSGFSKLTANQIGLHAKIKRLSRTLPKQKNLDKLDELAYLKGKKTSSSNSLRISNKVWKKLLNKPGLMKKDRLELANYMESPEYTDLQQLLNLFAENNNDVLFVIQPVNGKWANYLGLTKQKLENFSQKIRTQLTSQGFNQIADLTDLYDTPYASGDTIHLGYRGWLQADQAIEEFMKQPSEANYHLDNSRFLSRKWALNR